MKRRNFLPLLALSLAACKAPTPTQPTPPTPDTYTPSLTQLQNIYNNLHSLLTRIEALTPRDIADTRLRLRNADALDAEANAINLALLDQRDMMYRSSMHDTKQPTPVHPSHVLSFNLLYKATGSSLSATESLITTYNLVPQQPPLIATRAHTAAARTYLSQALESFTTP